MGAQTLKDIRAGFQAQAPSSAIAVVSWLPHCDYDAIDSMVSRKPLCADTQVSKEVEPKPLGAMSPSSLAVKAAERPACCQKCVAWSGPAVRAGLPENNVGQPEALM